MLDWRGESIFMNTENQARRDKIPKRHFYRIVPTWDGMVDIWLTPGEPVQTFDKAAGRYDYCIRVLAVRGIDPKDPQWNGDLEEHIRRHYRDWIASAEEIEL